MSFFKELLKRRVPQILGIYLATSWAIIEFLDWLINHFSISPHLPELGLVTLASMVPTVLLLAYFHGKPGRDRWTRVEKIGIPTNVVAAILLLFFVFKGKDLGATTALVTMENEEGELIERTIPKPEFRKKIMLFYLQNESGDTALNWLSYGFPEMLSLDLVQDYYLEVKTMDYNRTNGELMESGYPDLTGLPLMLEKEITEELHLDYFLNGSFTKMDDDYSVSARLYQSRNGKLLTQIELSDPDPFHLVDQLSERIKHDLEVPDYHIDEVDDLPVSEITTHSLRAFEWLIKGYNKINFQQDWNQGRIHLEQAIMEDTTFAYAYFNLYQVYLLTGQSEQGAYLFGPMMNHLYKLPEKIQFLVKSSYFEQQRQFDKQYAIFEMMVSLFPEDINARLNLIQINIFRNRIAEAISEYRYILELDPERYSVYGEIGALYEGLGDYDNALANYEIYAGHFADRPESYHNIGRLHRMMGNFEEARSSFEKAVILEPGNMDIMLQLADVEIREGNYDEALSQLNAAFEKTGTPREKAQVYQRLQGFHELRGEMDTALKYLDLKSAEWDVALVPLVATNLKIAAFDQYLRLAGSDGAMRILDSLSMELDALLKDYISIGYTYFYLETGNTEKAEEEILKVEKMISEMQLETLRSVTLNARGRVHEINEGYDQAVEYYTEQLALDPTNEELYIQLGRCFRKLEEYNKAEEAIQNALKVHPFHPEANYELALVYYETGEGEEAVSHLNRALTTWETADPDFEPALMARAMLEEWEGR